MRTCEGTGRTMETVTDAASRSVVFFFFLQAEPVVYYDTGGGGGGVACVSLSLSLCLSQSLLSSLVFLQSREI